MDGVCVGTGTPVTCTDGTILDSTTNTCVIDPASCQDGTVLIDGACKDPTAGLTVDVTEAVEPNALGVGGEDSDDPAGEFELKPVGGAAVVLQGNLNPHPDADEDGSPESDFDTYLFQVQTPTLVEISVDGVGGAAGGFVTLTGDNVSLIDWVRFGVNLTGDTSKRQVYLPAAGVYLLSIADTRSLVSGEAAGDANNKYYVSVKQLATPTATAVTLTAGSAQVQGTVADNEVKLYSAPMGAGFNTASLTTYNDNFRGALIAVNQSNAVRGTATENKSGVTNVPATLTLGGFQGATPSALLVVDHVINSAGAAVDFRLDVTQGNAQPIPTTSGTVMQPNPTDVGPASVNGLALYYFDVNSPTNVIGLDLAFNELVDGMIVDENGTIVSEFSYFQAAADFFGTFADGFGWDAWQAYKGGFRVRNAGRYYVAVYSPILAPDDDLILTGFASTITTSTLTINTPVTNVAPNAFNQNFYDYSLGGEAWHNFSIDGDVDADGGYFYVFDKSSAFGRLNDLSTDGGGTGPDAPVVISAGSFANDPITQGLIAIGLPDTVLVGASTFLDDGTFTLGTAPRTYTNEGTQAAGANVTKTGEAFGGDGTKRYLIRVAAGSKVSVTVDPAAALDVSVSALDYDEFVLDSADTGALDGTETLDAFGDTGYVALEVVSESGTGTFDLTYTVTAPVPPVTGFAIAAGTTAWSNACNGGTDVTPADRDDGTTAAITIPTGFTYYASEKTAVIINANGWLSFNTTDTFSASSTYTPRRFPATGVPNGLIAPYWTDITNTRICTKTAGTKFIVQWRGNVRGDSTVVATQVILDASNDTIEVLYAPYHEGDGSFASGGVESGTGTQGASFFFDQEDAVVPGTSKKLTPN